MIDPIIEFTDLEDTRSISDIEFFDVVRKCYNQELTDLRNRYKIILENHLNKLDRVYRHRT